MRIFSVTIIKGKCRFLLELSLGVTIITSVIIVMLNNVNAQSIESINRESRLLGQSPQIWVEKSPGDIQINTYTNKIYVANSGSASVSVLDSASGITKSIHVGGTPRSIAINEIENKIYVTNVESNSVSVIDGDNDSKIGKDISLGSIPTDIVTSNTYGMTYVSETDNTVSVINDTTDKVVDNISVGIHPARMVIDNDLQGVPKIYVSNADNNTVSVIDILNGMKEPNDIRVGKDPMQMAVGHEKIYVTTCYSFRN